MNICLCQYCRQKIDPGNEYLRGEMVILHDGAAQRSPYTNSHPRRYVHYHLGCYETACLIFEQAIARSLGSDERVPASPDPLPEDEREE